MIIPDSINKIFEVFKASKYQLFICGGAVRDFVLNEKAKDYDLVTNAFPNTVETIMNEAGFKTLSTGKSFGVINVFVDNEEFEIATFRQDSKESDGRRPNSIIFSSIDKDVKRRDLTINSLYYDLENKKIIDLVGGISDLKNNVIKTVGSARERFEEDKLRKLRAIRFAARFDATLSEDIHNTLKQNNSLEGVSKERIREEFIKAIESSKNVNYLLTLYQEYEMFSEIFPNLFCQIHGVSKNVKNPIFVIALLLAFSGIEKNSKRISFLHKLKYSVEEIRQIIFLIKLHWFTDVEEIVALKKLQKISNLTMQEIQIFINEILIECSDKEFETQLKKFLKFELSISGIDVMKETGLTGIELGNEIKRREIENFKNS